MGSICLLRLTCLARADEGRIAKSHAERKCRCIVDLMRGGYGRWMALRLQRASGGTTHVIPADRPYNEVGYCAVTLEVMDAITSEALLKAASRFVIW
jgi:hypothetical protein